MTRCCKAGASLLLLATLAVGADRLSPPDLSRLDTVGREVLDSQGRTLAVLAAEGGMWRLRTTAEQVPLAFIDRLVASEDRRFWWHPGVDPIAIGRAFWEWLRHAAPRAAGTG